MQLSVFSFTPPSTNAAAGATSATGTALSTDGPDGVFAQLVQPGAVAGAATNSDAVAAIPPNAALEELLASLQLELTPQSELSSAQLERLAQTVQTALAQPSAASFSAELTNALEDVSALLSDISSQQTSISVQSLVQQVTLVAPQGAPIVSDNTDTLFNGIGAANIASDATAKETLNVLLSAYQNPDAYYQDLTAAAATQTVPSWVQHVQAIDAANAGPKIELPAGAPLLQDAQQRQASTDGRNQAFTNAAPASDGLEALPDALVRIDKAAAEREALQDARPIQPQQFGRAREGLGETLAPLNQFVQTNLSAPVTQPLFAPVIDAQSGVTPASYTQDASLSASRSPVADQVHVALKHASAEGLQRITIQLEPHEMGRIDVRIETTREGKTRLMFTADRPDTIDMLQRDIRALERTLQDSGLKTDAGNMEFHLRQQPGQQQAFGDGQAGQGDGTQQDAEAGTVGAAAADEIIEEANDELARLAPTEHHTHDVHYGVNVEV